MPYRLLEDRGYSSVNREEAAWLLKAGQVYDAQNMIFDKPGIARHRGPTTAVFSGAQSAAVETLGWVYQQDSTTPVEELYGTGIGGCYSINKATGAFTVVSTAGNQGFVGRPVRHFGFLGFPYTDISGQPGFIFVAGATTFIATFSSPTAGATLATTGICTLAGADLTTNVRAGDIVNVLTAANLQYYGRVVSVLSSTQFTVWPKPAIAFVGAANGVAYETAHPVQGATGCKCATSFQNRLLMGNVWEQTTGIPNDRRVYYSHLPTETTFLTPRTYYGAGFLNPVAWPTLNYFDVPGADPIVGMEPVNDGELLILTGGAPWVLRGQLATQSTTFAPGVTFDLSPINMPANCLADVSIQRTPRGIIWAGSEGIWIYGGGGRQPYSPGWRLPIDITEGAIHTYWRNLTRGANFAIHGSAQTRNHYILTGTSAGTTFCLFYNFASGAWSSGTNIDIYYGVSRPSDPSICHASRWWDRALAAPSMTNGQVLRLESVFQPYVAGTTKTDADGSTIPLSLTTRAISDDTLTQRILRRAAIRYQLAATTAAVAVAAGARIDPADTVGTPTVALGSLSSTKVLTITAATNATPIVCTTALHGLQSGDAVDIHGGLGMTAINGHWRIKVLSTTTFSLDQSAGNGAYTASSATSKKITEQEFEASGVDIGQANYLTFTGSPDDFELHGVRLGVMEMPLGMSK